MDVTGTIVATGPEFNPANCPHFIFDGDHYREDGSCKCDEPTAAVMAEWGYRWDGERWT